MTGHRHYGLDWLRIAAFGLLILYHVAMAYSPYPWVINSGHRAHWLAYAMEVVAPWRLMLLFLVSGYASAMLLAKLGTLRAFLSSRSRRLLIPLAFAIAVIVPPQSWVRQVIGHDYQGSYFDFWLGEYFRFGQMAEQTLPHWEHLWFVAYLWLYTLALAALVASGVRLVVPRWLLGIWGLLLIPIASLAFWRLALAATIGTDHGMLNDWLGHLHYIPAFVFGFLLARDSAIWDGLRRISPYATMVAISCLTIATAIEFIAPEHDQWTRALSIIFDCVDSAFAWSMLLVLPVLADRWLDRDHRWRLPLSRAIFPAYIVHQTVIVLLVYGLRDKGLDAGVEATLVLGGTIIACIATWLLARSTMLAGALLGYEDSGKSKRTPVTATA